MIFVVKYSWQGQTHRHLRDFHTLAEANELAREMKADGWRAWVETL